MLPIHLEAELEYAPIPMGRKAKEAACRKRIARFGINDPFEFTRSTHHGQRRAS